MKKALTGVLPPKLHSSVLNRISHAKTGLSAGLMFLFALLLHAHLLAADIGIHEGLENLLVIG
jgi:hypothetical protein